MKTNQVESSCQQHTAGEGEAARELWQEEELRGPQKSHLLQGISYAALKY